VNRRRTEGGHRVSVNNERCRRYGVCQGEAPDIFHLTTRGELRYRRTVANHELEQARGAVRCCPTMAILLEER